MKNNLDSKIKTVNLEVLAPVGDTERLISAVRYGADAVYLGGVRFGMRATPANFDTQELKAAVKYAHEHGVKVYLTCNILPKNHEIKDLEEFLLYAREVGVDALIVADIGILMAARRTVPELDIHISTQTGVVNYLTANELYNLGAKRVVLARELSLEEIAEIRANTPPELEIECFVHGAMCVSFSGRCLISNYMIGRDANRGECAQPCRWGYHLVEEKRPGQYYPVFEDEKGTYILNAKDLCMIEHIDKLAAAGITSLKIEGRAKSAYYVSVITNAYRAAVDGYLKHPENYRTEDWIVEETKKVSHRDYCTGFFFGPADNCMTESGYLREWDICAVAESYKDGRLYLGQRNKFLAGEVLEALAPGQKPFEIRVSGMRDENGEPIDSAHRATMKLSIECDIPLPEGAVLRKQKQD